MQFKFKKTYMASSLSSEAPILVDRKLLLDYINENLSKFEEKAKLCKHVENFLAKKDSDDSKKIIE